MDRIELLSKGEGGDAGDFARFGTGSYEVALLAVGGCIEALEAVW